MVYQKSIDTQNRIIESAKILFYENGYDATTVRQIVKQAGMRNHASIYQYFKNKSDIVKKITETYFDNVMNFAKEYIVVQEPLTRYFMIQMMVISEIMIDVHNSIYYSEFMKDTTFDFFETSQDKEYQSIFSAVTEKYSPKITRNEIIFSVSSYNATMAITIMNINKGALNISRDEAVKYMELFFPKLIGISIDQLEKKYIEAYEAYQLLPHDLIDKIKILK